jgi:DNA repair protein SbcD/Mre11
LIPLNFTEQTKKSVTLLNFTGRTFEKEIIPVPNFRKLLRLEGTYDEVVKALKALETAKNELTTWVEVLVRTDKMIPNLMDNLKEIVKNKNIEILNFRLDASTARKVKNIVTENLKTLSELEVFQRKCESEGYDEANTKALTSTFLELMNWINERDIE